jgi:hypothetical protein
MAIKIQVSDIVRCTVRGTIADESGTPQPFDFAFLARRLDSEQLADTLNSDARIADFLVELVTGWSGVKNADNEAVPFSEAALRQLLLIPGLARLMLSAYVADCGAKAKN